MNKKYKIIVDQNMPGVDELFSDLANITRVDGRSINHEQLGNADALLCRSITQVNQSLLQNTNVSFVGTGTIGTDHLDINWLESQDIQWANAAGCNAAAVAQYVLSAMAYWCQQKQLNIEALKVGIVGAGNVGTELARCLAMLNIRYSLFDPPLKEQGDSREMVSFDGILHCDVITLHVPISHDGVHPTQYLISKNELDQLNHSQLLINACRGAVIDNHALVEYLSQPESAEVVLDVFETEPNIPKKLLEQCFLTTPHIAGHTLEGKLRGTWLIYKAFCEHFNIPVEKNECDLYPAINQLEFESDQLIEKLLAVYDIKAESDSLKNIGESHIEKAFDQLRKNAIKLANGKTRRDYSGWSYQGLYRLPL